MLLALIKNAQYTYTAIWKSHSQNICIPKYSSNMIKRLTLYSSTGFQTLSSTTQMVPYSSMYCTLQFLKCKVLLLQPHKINCNCKICVMLFFSFFSFSFQLPKQTQFSFSLCELDATQSDEVDLTISLQVFFQNNCIYYRII